MKKIKVLVVDDSAIVREILAKGMSADPQLEIVGTAADVYIARDKIVYKEPDVITLDVEMPRMDGIDFLKRLMPQHPLPVVMVSALTGPGASLTLEALEWGAVDFVLKPSVKVGKGLQTMLEELKTKVKIAASVDVSTWKSRTPYTTLPPRPHRILVGSTDKVIAIGASTGGTEAITKLLTAFPVNMPGTVIVQHMPPVFTRLFAEKLDKQTSVEVKEAVSGDRIIPGRVLIAPGGFQCRVVRSGGTYLVECYPAEKINGHCPSVEVLFNSVAKHVGPNAIGIILTGMGKDGAEAMLNMRNAGARTIAQDEASCVVFGMPGEAYACGGAEKLVSLDHMPQAVIQLVNQWK